MRINHDIAAVLLNHQRIAFIVSDRAGTIRQVGGDLSLLVTGLDEFSSLDSPDPGGAALPQVPGTPSADVSFAATLAGQPVVWLLPELVGLEAELETVAIGIQPSIQLEFINRTEQHKKVTYLNLTVYPYPGPNNQVGDLIYLLEDVTPMGELNQRLTQQHNERYLLHMALERSNLDLAAANVELRALDELKSRFVSVAAHELRTPLSSILGYADFLLQDESEVLSATHRKGVDTIARSARRLLAVANDLLDVTRIEAGKLELTLQSINLALLTKALIEVFEPELAQKAQRLSVDIAEDLPAALCDEKRALQILTNLLSNAIKYTPPQGQIKVRLWVDRLQQMIVAAVADTGIGIPAADLPKIGKSFFRASNVHHARATGAGLGLNITISLVELHGGKLWLESEQGKGTTVFVTFAIAHP